MTLAFSQPSWTRVFRRLSARSVVLVVSLLLVAGVTAVLVATSVPSDESEAGRGAVLGRPAPDFSLPPVQEGQEPVSLAAALDDKRPVVLNFFASWCIPCREELPVLRQAALRHEGRVTFIGIDHLDQRDDAIALLDEFEVPYATGFDPAGETANAYLTPGLPATFFIGADGRIHDVHVGAIGESDLETRLRQLTLHIERS